MLRVADDPFPAAPRKQQKANESTFGEGAREHSHGASLGTAREEEAGGGGGGLEQDV